MWGCVRGCERSKKFDDHHCVWMCADAITICILCSARNYSPVDDDDTKSWQIYWSHKTDECFWKFCSFGNATSNVKRYSEQRYILSRESKMLDRYFKLNRWMQYPPFFFWNILYSCSWTWIYTCSWSCTCFCCYYCSYCFCSSCFYLIFLFLSDHVSVTDLAPFNVPVPVHVPVAATFPIFVSARVTESVMSWSCTYFCSWSCTYYYFCSYCYYCSCTCSCKFFWSCFWYTSSYCI